MPSIKQVDTRHDHYHDISKDPGNTSGMTQRLFKFIKTRTIPTPYSYTFIRRIHNMPAHLMRLCTYKKQIPLVFFYFNFPIKVSSTAMS